MIKTLSFSELVSRFGGECIHGDTSFDSVSTDTRTIEPGCLFVALVGEHFNGHDFIEQAIAKGAAALVVQKPYKQCSLPQWVVENTTHALGYIALLAREAFQGKLVGITGSSGKTTVKEMLHAIFQAKAGQSYVFATQGNFNNHIGVPFSLLSLQQQHTYAVIEMGASAVGEIDYLTHLAKPDVALVNNVMPAHIEGFGSLENIATGKGEIYNGLNDQGIAVVNIDDRFSPQWIEQNQQRQTIRFSLSGKDQAQVKATHIGQSDEGLPTFTLSIGTEQAEVCLNVLGKHNIANALAASACAYAAGVELEAIAQGLKLVGAVKGRLHTTEGVDGSTLIDDSYNANPGSVKAAIDVLGAIAKTKILILGDMGELGEHAESAHYDLGVYAKDNGIDHLLVLGDLAKHAAKGFHSPRHHIFEEHKQLVEAARALASNQTVFLVKGSRSSRMDRVVDALKKQRGEQHATVVS